MERAQGAQKIRRGIPHGGKLCYCSRFFGIWRRQFCEQVLRLKAKSNSKAQRKEEERIIHAPKAYRHAQSTETAEKLKSVSALFSSACCQISITTL